MLKLTAPMVATLAFTPAVVADPARPEILLNTLVNWSTNCCGLPALKNAPAVQYLRD